MTELGKYFETSNLGRNRYQTTIGIKQINFHNGHAWQRNNDNWVDSGISERPHMVVDAPFMVGVSPDGLRRIHPTREDDVWFEMSGAKINNTGTWEVVQLGTPTSRVGNRITWNKTNINAYMDMAGHYVKLGYLLKNGYLPPNNQFAYEVATNGLTREGGTLLKDGVPVMHMRKPIAYDYDNPEDVRQIAHEIVRIDGKWHVIFTLPDLTGMSKPVIDPTLTLQPDATAGIDTSIGAGGEGTNLMNLGVTPQLIVGNANVNDDDFRALIKFDLSSLPAGAVISGTTLSLYCEDDHSDNTRIYRVFRQKRVWLEGDKNAAADAPASGATWERYDTSNNWATAGGFGANDCEQTDIGTRSFTASETLNQFKDFSLTATSKTDLDYGLEQSGSATGLMIKADTETNDRYDFASSDGTTAANRPKLVVDYTEAGGAKGGMVPTLMPLRRRRGGL